MTKAQRAYRRRYAEMTHGDRPDGLTERQAEVIRAVWDFAAARGQWPTYRELMAVMGITSPNGILCHLSALWKKGYLENEPRARGEGVTARNNTKLAGVALAPRIAEGEAGDRLRAALGEGGGDAQGGA